MKTFAFQFSGGKDSLATLLLMRPFFDQGRVYFANPGAQYPHVVEFVRTTCARLGVELVEVTPPMPIAEFHALAGIPADIVPMQATRDIEPLSKRTGIALQSPLACCMAMMWLPVHRRMLADGIKYVVRGSKKADRLVAMGDGGVDADGLIYLCPVWEWNDEQVYSFLAREGVALPPHYAEVGDGLDCMSCTAYLDDPATVKRLDWTRRNVPEIWPEIAGRLRFIRETIDQERAAIADALAMA